jgi:integrase
MARAAEGWKLVWNRGVAHVRFTYQGKRHQISTGSRDPEQASTIAARIYADFISGRVKRAASGALVHPATPLDELCADWLDAIANELGEGTGGTYEVYARHWCAAMPTIGDVSAASIGEYQRARLGVVQRSTVIKERSGLTRMLTWLIERGVLGEMPDFPSLPKKATGKRHKQGRRRPTNVLTLAEVEAVLEKLSARSRDFCVALFETGLRPISTLSRLLPEDLTPFGLHIRPEADKNRWERTVPLTARARAALERGLPFGRHDRRTGWNRAVALALGATRAATVYDLKHARITSWVDEGRPLGGISYLTGVSVETLTSRYARPTRRAADDVIRFHSGAEPAGESCEGGDLNPYESYLASTSSKFACKERRLLSRAPGENTAGTGPAILGSGAGHQKAPVINAAPLGTEWPHAAPTAGWRHSFCHDWCPQHGAPECERPAS